MASSAKIMYINDKNLLCCAKSADFLHTCRAQTDLDSNGSKTFTIPDENGDFPLQLGVAAATGRCCTTPGRDQHPLNFVSGLV